MKKFIIFDLDGTLLDSMHIWKNVGSDFLKLQGIIAPDDIQAILKVMSLEQGANYLIKHFNLSLSNEEVIEGIKNIVKSQYELQVQLKPFVLDYLLDLKRRKVKMCIATASELDHTISALKRLQIFDLFEYIYTCTEIGYGKDHPAIFNRAAEKWGVQPSEIAVFEDALHSIQTAKEAGFFTVGVFDPSAETDCEKIKKISDVYIQSFEDLRDEK